MAHSETLLNMLLLLPWSALWLLGGIWLSKATFRLRPNEEMLVGIALGWFVQNWLVNFLVRVMPFSAACWAAAGGVFLAGLLVLGLRSGWKALIQVSVSPLQMILLGAVVLVSFEINRGLAIFDDFAHLPTVSTMAAGDIPPHFSLDPQISYAYHYFLLLFSAQLIRIAGMMPWLALDAGRALSFGLAVMLAGVWTQRLTRSPIGGFVGGAFLAFGSGTRWLMLILPSGIVAWLGRGVQMQGSGIQSGPTMAEALLNAWTIEGGGPVPFLFAFANGIYTPGVITSMGANGAAVFVLIFLLLLTFNRWQGKAGPVLTIILISVWGLLGEAELVGIAAGWALVVLAYGIKYKTFQLPRGLAVWVFVIAAGCLIGLLSGGAWTDVLAGWIRRVSGGPAEASYQSIGFTLAAPAIVSSHLGVLSLLNPSQLLVALFELGPVLLVYPLLAAWGIKAFRLRRWYEAATAATALVMLLMVFVQFTGSTGVRNTPRLYVFLPLLACFAVALAWIWAARRSQAVKVLVAGLGLISMMGGVLVTGTELFAIQRPVYSYFLTALDARMTRQYWDQLEPGAMVFDAEPSRSVMIFGRPSDAAYSWYQFKPGWEELRRNPDPYRLNAAGFGYLYLDEPYWDDIGLQKQQAFSGSCVKMIAEYTDPLIGYRRLYDLRSCR